ncbi:MAG TPA: hypothetical protein VFF16_10045 [Telluria sp.]|nr:hypothetical protein [Telluria sp.]
MSMYRLFKSCLAVFTISAGLSAAPAAHAERGPATPEEQARVIALAAVADKDPLAAMTSPEGRWFMKWSDDVPDYNFGPDKGAFLLMNNAKGDLRRVVRFQHDLSSAVFQLEHQIHDPQKNPADFDAKTIAALKGLLHAYETMLTTHPDIRAPQLDEAIAARDKGTLADFVKALPPMPPR